MRLRQNQVASDEVLAVSSALSSARSDTHVAGSPSCERNAVAGSPRPTFPTASCGATLCVPRGLRPFQCGRSETLPPAGSVTINLEEGVERCGRILYGAHRKFVASESVHLAN